MSVQVERLVRRGGKREWGVRGLGHGQRLTKPPGPAHPFSAWSRRAARSIVKPGRPIRTGLLDFTFAIALTPAATAGSWPLAQALLGLTLASLAAQTQADFSVLIAGHDRPVLPHDPRVIFLPVDWPVRPPGPHNDDSGRKKHFLSEVVLSRGGGLMMIVDADDWIDRRTVELSRRALAGDQDGGVIVSGEVVDVATLRTAPLPHPAIFGEFHRVCGSSTVTRLRPYAADPLRRDPFSVLRSHHAWLERAEEVGARLVRLPVSAAYLVGTSINHSDLHGPHAEWRRSFRAALNTHGSPLQPPDAVRYGLKLDAVRAVSAQVQAASTPAPARRNG